MRNTMCHWGRALFLVAHLAGTGMTSAIAAEAFLVRDLRPGDIGSNPFRIGQVGRNLIFGAWEYPGGVEVWRSDGTEVGTVKLSNLEGPGGLPGYLGEGVPLRGGLLFTAKATGASTVHLYWITPDGLEARFAHDLKGKTSQLGAAIGVWNDRAYFAASNDDGEKELWSTDGTPEGTHLVADLDLDKTYPIREFYLFPGKGLMFRAVTAEYRDALFITDGTVDGARLLCGQREDILSFKSFVGIFEGFCYFGFNDGVHGDELWRTDGTPEGTGLFVDINLDPDSECHGNSAPLPGHAADSYLVFSACDSTEGNEPWITDGTVEGTKLLLDINTDFAPFSNVKYGSSNPSYFSSEGDTTYFTAFHHNIIWSLGIWRTDGTAVGTIPIHEVLDDSETQGGDRSTGPGTIVWVNGRMFFSWNWDTYSTNHEIWSGDGSPGSAAIWGDIPPTNRSSIPVILGVVNGLILVQAEVAEYGQELFAVELPPWVESIRPRATEPSDAQEAEFLVKFSEDVDGVSPSCFRLEEEGTEGASIVAVEEVEGEDHTWLVRVDTGVGNGEIRLRLEDDDQIYDRRGLQPLVGWAMKEDGSAVGSQPLVVSRPNPVPHVSANVAAVSHKAHAKLNIAFDTPVDGLDLADLEVLNGEWGDDWRASGDGMHFSVSVLANSPGLVAARVRGGVAVDTEANANAPSRWIEWRYVPVGMHSADSDGDFAISLSELLRVIQLYNATLIGTGTYYHCDASGEDGYGLGEAVSEEEACVPHAVDYAPQDWRVGLSELLRMIQIYNVPGRSYAICPEEAQSEDGFCLVLATP